MIEIKNLNCDISKRKILKDINLKFEKGKTYGIIGPNGSGKSTILKNIMRIIEPKKNSISLNGKDVREYSSKEYSKKISFVFQENNRDIEFSVYEIIMMGRYPYIDLLGSPSDSDNRIVEDIMKAIDIYHLKDRYISELSGGEAQKVFIGRALVQKTEIILLDEPTSMLDIHNSVEIMQLIEKIKLEHNLTVIMVLHDLNLAFSYCDEIILLEDGTIKLTGDKNKVINSNDLKTVYKDRIKVEKLENEEYVIIAKR